MLLTAFSVAGEPYSELGRGLVHIGPRGKLLSDLVAYVLFGLNRTESLPSKGPMALRLVSGLDGRPYQIRRVRERPQDWTVADEETGYTAASGSELVSEWVQRHMELSEAIPLSCLFTEAICFSLPSTLTWLSDQPELRELKLRTLLGMEHYPAALRRGQEVVGRSQERTQLISLAAERKASIVDRLVGAELLVKDLQRERADLESEAADLRAAREAWQEREERKATLRGRLGDLSQRVEELRAQKVRIEANLASVRATTEQLDRVEISLAALKDEVAAYRAATDAEAAAMRGLAALEPVQRELSDAVNSVAMGQATALSLDAELSRAREAKAAATALEQPAVQQETLEKRISVLTEQTFRLAYIKKTVDDVITESKRVEALASEIDRQIDEMERGSGRARRIGDIEQELTRLDEQLREATRQALQLSLLEQNAAAAMAQLDHLRRTVLLGERSPVPSHASGVSDQPNLVTRLREAIQQEVDVLDGRIQGWQRQIRDLASAPAIVDQAQAAKRRLQEDLTAARESELRVAGGRGLRQQRKQLDERLQELKRTLDGLHKEQQEIASAPSQLEDTRRELGALGDPRTERQVRLTLAAREAGLESELRSARRTVDERLKHQRELEQRLASKPKLDESLAQARSTRDQHEEAYLAYVGQRSVAEALQPSRAALAAAQAELAATDAALAEAEAEAHALAGEAQTLAGGEDLTALERQLAVVETRLAHNEANAQRAEADALALQEAREELTEHQGRLAHLERAASAMVRTSSVIEQAGRELGGIVRAEVARLAATFLSSLLPERPLSLTWTEQLPLLAGYGETQVPITELPGVEQLFCAISFRLALLRSLANVGTVFVEGLAPFEQQTSLTSRLQRIPTFDLILAIS